MATRETNPAAVDGAGSILGTVAGPSNAVPPASLGGRNAIRGQPFSRRKKLARLDHQDGMRGSASAAHGYFESYRDFSDLTRAAPFSAAGKRTPVFARFSPVAGEHGPADAARGVRGFAVRFYTDECNWDLAGNSIPAFFSQDAMALHDAFRDFVSLAPESPHMLVWYSSDDAIARSYLTIQRFGVPTFRLLNADGQSRYCKFHWTPLQAPYSLVWDEAARIAGADPDFHRRDLWGAIESGSFPQWELGLQLFTEEEAGTFGFDVLDPAVIVPEELVPITPVGRIVLNHSPDYFFAGNEPGNAGTMHVDGFAAGSWPRDGS